MYLSQCLPERGQGRSDQSGLTYLTQTTFPVVSPLLRPPPTLLLRRPPLPTSSLGGPPLLPPLPTLRRALSHTPSLLSGFPLPSLTSERVPSLPSFPSLRLPSDFMNYTLVDLELTHTRTHPPTPHHHQSHATTTIII
ncbi:hypothetical protein Pcinc_036144 [Petrolisthes cinctipes]|uniref:Uncharacterized protein n=1 Tax=Petrolisthes cinctipes TaxID=88211 RepID=A0AAE1BYA7_PETCI|nr:hypothetical protein Pcinc_036144 [Petrolisthes cinctipes]